MIFETVMVGWGWGGCRLWIRGGVEGAVGEGGGEGEVEA